MHRLAISEQALRPVVDQKMVGQSLVDAGAGRLMPKKAKPAAIAAVVAELMDEGPHRDAAARLGATIRSTSGASAGAELVESVSNSRAVA